jgi:four helix bundle protein
MSYKNLEIWKLADEVVIEIHQMTLTLPKFEMFEEGRQIRKSSKTTKSTIVEGYGRRRYKADYVKYLVYALSSNDESIDHLENLFKTKSLTDKNIFDSICQKLHNLGKKINRFIIGVERITWNTDRPNT